MRTIRKTTKSQRTPTTEIRGLILDASKRIIEEDGYDAFTIRLLSEKADVSPASIYRHIGDKQAVIDALIDDSFQTLREKLLRVTTEDPLQRLYDAGVVYRGHAKASPGIYALLWRWHAGEASEACLAAMTELVRYGQAAGKIRRDDPHLIAWSIWSAVHGFVQFETRPEHDTPVDDDDAAYSGCSFEGSAPLRRSPRERRPSRIPADRRIAIGRETSQPVSQRRTVHPPSGSRIPYGSPPSRPMRTTPSRRPPSRRRPPYVPLRRPYAMMRALRKRTRTA